MKLRRPRRIQLVVTKPITVNGEVYTYGDEVQTASTRVTNTGRGTVVSVTGNGNIVASTSGSNTAIGDGNVVSVGGSPSRVSNAKTTTVIVGKNCITGYGRIDFLCHSWEKITGQHG